MDADELPEALADVGLTALGEVGLLVHVVEHGEGAGRRGDNVLEVVDEFLRAVSD